MVISGANGDYINIALREGGISISINLGAGLFETDIHPHHGTVRFDDNEWHKLAITREAREVTPFHYLTTIISSLSQ